MPPSLTFLSLGFVHPDHIENLHQLKTLYMETREGFFKGLPCSSVRVHPSDYPPSLTEFTILIPSSNNATTRLEGDSLPRNLTKFVCNWEFDASTIDQLPTGLTSLTCDQILVFDAVSYLCNFKKLYSSAPSVPVFPNLQADHPLLQHLPSFMRSYSAHTVCEPEYLAKIIITSIAKFQRPQLQLSACRPFHLKVTKIRKNSRSLASMSKELILNPEEDPKFWSLLPSNVTSLTYKTSIDTLPELSVDDLSLLPASLTQLDLFDYMMPHDASKHLPRHLIDLAIDSRLFTVQSYSRLPRNLRSLHLKAKKWTTKHSVALPPSLTNLYLDISVVPAFELTGLPSSIRALRINHRAFRDKHIPQLPPNLVFFNSNSEFLSGISIEYLKKIVENCVLSKGGN